MDLPLPRAAHAWAETEEAVDQRLGLPIGSIKTTTASQTLSPPTAEVRAWARSAGIAVTDRGRLRPEVLRAWRDAQQDPGSAADR